MCPMKDSMIEYSWKTPGHTEKSISELRRGLIEMRAIVYLKGRETYLIEKVVNDKNLRSYWRNLALVGHTMFMKGMNITVITLKASHNNASLSNCPSFAVLFIYVCVWRTISILIIVILVAMYGLYTTGKYVYVLQIVVFTFLNYS